MSAGTTPLTAVDIDSSGELRGTGQFILIRHLPDDCASIAISADQLGLIPLYWHSSARGVAVSNRLHLISDFLHKNDCRVAPCLPAIFAKSFVDKSFCIQATTQETAVESVNMSLPGQRLVISSGGLKIEHGSRDSYSRLTLLEYDSLIKEAANEIRSNIIAAFNCDAFPRLVSTLTGGRDSRAIFAALVSLGLERTVPFQTQPIDEEDVRIATGLVQAFGAHFDAAPLNPAPPPSPEQHFATHRSIFFGQYSDLKKVPTTVPAPGLRLIGGCGEVYRGFYTKQYSAQLTDKPYGKQALRDLLSAHTFWPIFSPSIFEPACEVLDQTFQSLPGDTLAEKLEEHYLCFRNRLHFGTAGTHRHPHVPVFQPLVSPSLLKASRGLPFAVRISGRAIYDVTAQLSSEVAHLPYAVRQLTKF